MFTLFSFKEQIKIQKRLRIFYHVLIEQLVKILSVEISDSVEDRMISVIWKISKIVVVLGTI